MKIRVTALKPQRYAKNSYVAGDVFEIDERDLRILSAIGSVARHVEEIARTVEEVPVVSVEQPSESVTLSEEPAFTPEPEAEAEPRPRRYRRRDMQAEGSDE